MQERNSSSRVTRSAERSSAGGGRGRRFARVLTALLTTAALIAVFARLRGWEYGPLLIVVAATPYVVVASLVALALALYARSRRWSALSIAAGIVLTLTQLPLFIASDDRDAKVPALTVLTANLTVGRGSATEVVRRATEGRADLVAVQELTPEAEVALRAAGIDSTYPHNFAAAAPGVVGTGLWSRFPLSDTRVLPDFFMNQLVARVTPPAPAPADLTVAVVHPYAPTDLWHRKADVEALRLRGELTRLPGSVVAVGDFNATADSATLRLLGRAGFRNAADGAGAGFIRTWAPLDGWPRLFGIDHVLIRGPMSGGRIDRLPITGADHDALLVELRR